LSIRVQGFMCKTFLSTDVKLVNGVSECDGRVQIRHREQWGAVCYTGWDLQDATVLCQELDCGEIAEPKAYVGPSVEKTLMNNSH